MQIVLLGARGSGKTTVGRAVANHFGVEFVDVDDVIVARANKSIAAIFADDGEPAFRDLESAVIEDVVRWTGDRVVSLGGGSVVRAANRELLARCGAYRYYLRCDPATLDERIRADPRTAATRPALTRYNGVDEIRHLLAIREPLYREVKSHEIDVTHLSSNQVARMIVAEVQGDTGTLLVHRELISIFIRHSALGVRCSTFAFCSENERRTSNAQRRSQNRNVTLTVVRSPR